MPCRVCGAETAFPATHCEKPTSLTAETPNELAKLFDRAKSGEFRCISMEYGQGRPGKPFCKIGISWPEEKQTTLL